MTVHGARSAPVRNAVSTSIGFVVAEMPTRVGGGAHERFEPLERQREMRAALVAGERVNLVDDHRAHGRQHLAGPTRP